MKLQVFTVFDSKVGNYLPPFFARSIGEALRSFETAVKDSSHQFSKYAEDFTLFHVGTWDDSNCKFDLNPALVSLGVAVEFLKEGS